MVVGSRAQDHSFPINVQHPQATTREHWEQEGTISESSDQPQNPGTPTAIPTAGKSSRTSGVCVLLYSHPTPVSASKSLLLPPDPKPAFPLQI